MNRGRVALAILLSLTAGCAAPFVTEADRQPLIGEDAGSDAGEVANPLPDAAPDAGPGVDAAPVPDAGPSSDGGTVDAAPEAAAAPLALWASCGVPDDAGIARAGTDCGQVEGVQLVCVCNQWGPPNGCGVGGSPVTPTTQYLCTFSCQQFTPQAPAMGNVCSSSGSNACTTGQPYCLPAGE